MHDIPKIFTAVAEWSACLVFVMTLKNRFSSIKTAGIMVSILAVLGVLHVYIGIWPVVVWIPAMFVAMAIMYLCILICCNVNLLDCGLYWAIAFIEAEFVASLEWQMYTFFAGTAESGSMLEYGVMILFYLLLFGLFYVLQRRLDPENNQFDISAKELFGCILMTIAVFFLSNISYVFPDTPFSISVNEGVFYIRTLVDFSGVVILYAQQSRFRENRLQMELATRSMLMEHQFEQYQLSKSNIEILNRKYHDLKHQIAIIRAESDDSKREGYLEEMETGLRLYETQNKTGNSILDTILTGKKMYCVQHDINFSCVANGSLLNFMNVMDMCAIFGNALDNAIESVEKVADCAKRVIRVAVYQEKQFVIIRFENYYELEYHTEKQGGIELPQTTKKEKEYHGFGIKSIRSSAEKYGGTMTIRTENSWFYLRLLIPLHEKNEIAE